MASPTMMASSTITPITSRKAKVEIILKETSKSGSRASPPANAAAIPALTQKAIMGRKNRNKVAPTNNSPIRKFFVMVEIRPTY